MARTEQPPGKGYAAPPPAGFRSTLILRRNAEGELRIQGELPERHVFPASFVERELGQAVTVQITLHTVDGPVVYEMTGFEPLEDGRINPTGWVASRVVGG